MQLIFHESYKPSNEKMNKFKACSSKCDCSNDDCPNFYERRKCPKNCKNCSNQYFRNKKHVKVKEKKTKSKGIGIFSKEFIKRGRFVIPFIGEVIGKEEKEIRAERYFKNKQEKYFYGNFNYFIDATVYGNEARFVNHSCDPNMIAEKFALDGTPVGFKAIGFVARRNIKKGEELTLNYNFGSEDPANIKCTCKKKVCSGVMGKRKMDLKKGKTVKKVLKKKMTKKVKKAGNSKKVTVTSVQSKPAANSKKRWKRGTRERKQSQREIE